MRALMIPFGVFVILCSLLTSILRRHGDTSTVADRAVSRLFWFARWAHALACSADHSVAEYRYAMRRTSTGQEFQAICRVVCADAEN